MVMGMSEGTATDASRQSRSELSLVGSGHVGEGHLLSTGMDADSSGRGQQGAIVSSGAAGAMLSAADAEGAAFWRYLEEAAPYLDGLKQAMKR